MISDGFARAASRTRRDPRLAKSTSTLAMTWSFGVPMCSGHARSDDLLLHGTPIDVPAFSILSARKGCRAGRRVLGDALQYVTVRRVHPERSRRQARVRGGQRRIYIYWISSAIQAVQ